MQTTTTTEKTLTNINEIIEMSKKCSNEYHRKRIEETIKQHEEIQKYYPCSINVDFTIYEDNEKESIYAERMSIFLNHEYIKIEIRFDEYRKKYNIFAHFDRIFLNVDHYKRREIEKTVTAPKNIGVLTTKKINDWVSYYEKIYNLLNIENQKNANKIEQFKNKLLALDLPIQWYKNGNSGYIDNKEKGLTYTFEILESGYIKEDIRITKSSNLDTFLNLIK